MSAFSQYAAYLLAAPSSSSTLWTRPTDWLTLPDVPDGTERIVALHAVQSDNALNYCAFVCAGAYTVDWGDGVVESFAANVQAQHQYNFADTDLGAATSEGWKQAIISITPQSGNTLTKAYMLARHSGAPTGAYTCGIRDLYIGGPTMTDCRIGTDTSGLYYGQLANHSLLTVGLYLPSANQTPLRYCTSIKTVYKYTHQASKTDLSYMFQNCFALQSLPSGFSVPASTNTSSMFLNCFSLQSLPAGFSAPVATNTGSMFLNCFSLQSLPAGFSAPASTNTGSMFNGCYSLQSLPAGFSVAASTNTGSMFNGCYSLQSLPAGFSAPVATNTGSMFYACYSLQSLPAGFSAPVATNTGSMFYACFALQSLPSGFSAPVATNTGSMFYACFALQSLPSGFSVPASTNTSSMFLNCFSLQSLPAGFSVAASTNTSGMFQYCYSLQSLPAGFTCPASTDTGNMFLQCYELQEIPSGFSISASATTTTSMFASCSGLQRAPNLGIRVSFSIASCYFSAAALDELYTGLGTVTGQTITVTSNPGTTGDNPSIATAKGWTVTGS